MSDLETARAKEVFLEVGIARATIEQVAARAGVSPATVYRHFGDRKGLFTAYIETRGPRSARRESERGGTGP